MKYLALIPLICSFIAFQSGCSESDPDNSGPERAQYIREDIIVELGTCFEISEKECGCTEYHLEILWVYNEECIELVEYSTEHTGSSDPGWVGGSTIHTWKFLTKKRGTVIYQFGWVSRRSGIATIKTYYIGIK